MSDPITFKKSGISAEFIESKVRPGWDLVLDGFIQSNLDLEHPETLHLEYAKRIGALIDSLYQKPRPISVLHIGAAALSIPRAIEKTRPNSTQVGIELEEELIDLVLKTFPLPEDTKIEIVCADAFSYVDQKIEENYKKFDVVITDFYIANYLPYKAPSIDFYTKLKSMTKTDGILIVNAVEDVEKQLDFAYSQFRNIEEVYGAAIALADPSHLREGRKTNILLVGGDMEMLHKISELRTDTNMQTIVIKDSRAKEWFLNKTDSEIYKFLENTALTAKFKKALGHSGWDFYLGGIVQSNIDIDDPATLNFDHQKRLGILLEEALVDKKQANILHLGAGAMSIPRYIAAACPDATQKVVDLDKEIIDFVLENFPIKPDDNISYFFGDAKEVCDTLVEPRGASFDLVIVDLNLRSEMPEHLSSLEFFSLIKSLLLPDGLVFLNILDSSRGSSEEKLGTIGIDALSKVESIFGKSVAISYTPEILDNNRLYVNIVGGSELAINQVIDASKLALEDGVSIFST